MSMGKNSKPTSLDEYLDSILLINSLFAATLPNQMFRQLSLVALTRGRNILM